MSVPRTRSARSGRTIFERGKTDGGAQIRVGAQFAAQAEESGFGAEVVGIVIEGGASYGAEQDCGGREARLDCVGG